MLAFALASKMETLITAAVVFAIVAVFAFLAWRIILNIWRGK